MKRSDFFCFRDCLFYKFVLGFLLGFVDMVESFCRIFGVIGRIDFEINGLCESRIKC